MRVNKAKRRLIKWYRYIDHTDSAPANRRLGGYHTGHLNAWAGVTYAKRWAPVGIRAPWPPTSHKGGA